jgi:predicted transcriptional regulator
MTPDAETKDIKAAVLELVDDLPNDATWEDVMYRVYVREAIEAGRRDAAEGRLVDLAEVRRRFGLPE